MGGFAGNATGDQAVWQAAAAQLLSQRQRRRWRSAGVRQAARLHVRLRISHTSHPEQCFYQGFWLKADVALKMSLLQTL